MDEISTSLDSSTTSQIVNSLQQSVRILNGTAVISLLQTPPETYVLCNDIILLSDGRIAGVFKKCFFVFVFGGVAIADIKERPRAVLGK